MVGRSGRGRGRPPPRRRPSPEPASARRSPSPAQVSETGAQAEMWRMLREEQRALREEQARARADQERSMGDIARVLDTVREMAVSMARLEKRSVEVETPAATSEPAPASQPPQHPTIPIPPLYPTIPTPAPVVGTYEIPPPRVPVGPPPAPTESGQTEPVRQRHFVQGESSGGQAPQYRVRWDVDRFLKNGGRLFYGSTDPEVSLRWLDTARSVLQHIGCPADSWVRMATGAMQDDGRLWWDTTHGVTFEWCPLEEITWDRFRDAFYEQYFSATVREAKMVEFLALRQTEDMSVAQYQARFIILERFAHTSLTSERERASQFVSGLRISLRSVVAPFSCATISEAVARALQAERAHVTFQQERTAGQGRGRTRALDQQQGHQSQRQRSEARVAAFDGQVQRFPRQTDSFQDQRQQPQDQTDEPQRYPRCPSCRRRHLGECGRISGACFTCGGVGHRASVCPSGDQYQQPQYQQPQHQQLQQQGQQYQRFPQQLQRAVFAPQQEQYRPGPPAQPQYAQQRLQHGRGRQDYQRQADVAALVEEDYSAEVEPLAVEREADARPDPQHPA